LVLRPFVEMDPLIPSPFVYADRWTKDPERTKDEGPRTKD
jgi:hypothetical protein